MGGKWSNKELFERKVSLIWTKSKINIQGTWVDGFRNLIHLIWIDFNLLQKKKQEIVQSLEKFAPILTANQKEKKDDDIKLKEGSNWVSAHPQGTIDEYSETKN